MTKEFLNYLSVTELHLIMEKKIDEYLAAGKAGDLTVLRRKKAEILMISDIIKAKDKKKPLSTIPPHN